jgi:hypothetical protein
LVSGLKASGEKAFEGKGSLAISLSASASTQAYLKLTSSVEALGPGSIVRFHLWIPEGANFSGLEPYSSDSKGAWNGNYSADFKAGDWNTLEMKIPCSAVAPIKEIGLYLFGGPTPAKGATAYLDAIGGTRGSDPLHSHPKPALIKLVELP